ncbi:MAG: hypothetical protein WCF92_01555 [bacterium]
MKHLTIDLGDTLFDRKLPKIECDKWSVYRPFPAALGILNGCKSAGWKISVISKISLGDELRIGMNLIYHNIVPHIIDVSDVHFCYRRMYKGGISHDIGSDIHIDDRIECLNSVHGAGVPHKILFIGGHDERDTEKLLFEGVHIAQDWIEVGEILRGLE